jgi:predicted AAA+ superfamily ATPase
LFDTGLLITQIFLERPVSDNDLYRKLILNKLSINQGMFVENLVAQMLVARSHKLFYYFENRLGKYGEMEIDFIINEKNKIAPIEVKSGKYNKHSSIDKFVIKYSGIIRNKYIIYTNDYLNEGGYEHLPLYYVPFKF